MYHVIWVLVQIINEGIDSGTTKIIKLKQQKNTDFKEKIEALRWRLCLWLENFFGKAIQKTLTRIVIV